MSNKVYEIVTQRITDEMAKGNIPWVKPWNAHTVHPANYSGRHYNGMNFFLMSLLNFEHPIFLTYKQIAQAGGKFKQGQEKNHYPIFFWGRVAAEKTNAATGETEEYSRFIFRYFRVWNIGSLENVKLPAWYVKKQALNKEREFTPIESCENIVSGYKTMPEVTYGGSRACYIPSTDKIELPKPGSFIADESYYATTFHEMGHSTGHRSRLNRKEVMDPIMFGSHDYSVEELVAELTAAFLCADAGVANDSLVKNHAAYLQGWMKKLKEDPKIFPVAAARAQKAADYIIGRSSVEVTGEE